MRFLRHALACAIFLAPLAAPAATTTAVFQLTLTSYTDLGVGPMHLSAAGGDVVYQISTTQPSAQSTGFIIKAGEPFARLDDVTDHVWARANIPSGALAIVASGTGIVLKNNGGGGAPAATYAVIDGTAEGTSLYAILK